MSWATRFLTQVLLICEIQTLGIQNNSTGVLVDGISGCTAYTLKCIGIGIPAVGTSLLV